MEKLQCAQIWGGIDEADDTIASPGLTASLYSSSGDGNKGGDIYYISLCNSTYITRVAIADVVGHGEMVSKMSQSLYESLNKYKDGLNGSELLTDWNRDALERGITAMTTGIIATYYREDKSLSFVYAGHPTMLLNCKGTTKWEEMNHESDHANNIPLAVDANANYEQQSIKLNSGDRILLYTDGLIETPSENNEAFGLQRLVSTLEENAEAPLDELKQRITTALCQHASGKLDHDDVTLLLLEIR